MRGYREGVIVVGEGTASAEPSSEGWEGFQCLSAREGDHWVLPLCEFLSKSLFPTWGLVDSQYSLDIAGGFTKEMHQASPILAVTILARQPEDLIE